MKNEKVIENTQSIIVVATKQCVKDLNMIKKINKIRVTLVEEINQLQV